MKIDFFQGELNDWSGKNLIIGTFQDDLHASIENLPNSFKFLDERLQEVCRRGANMRTKLIEIPSFPLATALRECVKLRRRLPRMFKKFEELQNIATLSSTGNLGARGTGRLGTF